MARSSLPNVLFMINVATVIALVVGRSFIKGGNRAAHRVTMIVASLLGGTFMAIYLSYHFSAGLAKFGGRGFIRPVYFTILTAHIIAASVAAPVVPITVWRALSGKPEAHRRMARWAWPLWFFVAVSGIVIYVMVMHLWPYTGP